MSDARDPLSDWLDKKSGSSVTEQSIFRKLSEHWEAEYHKDMDALNVRKLLIIFILFHIFVNRP